MISINTEFLQNGPVLPSQISDVIKKGDSKNIGAHSIFLGQVRGDIIDNKEVKEIEYSAYPEMVKSEMNKITTEVSNKYHDIQQIYIVHSIGRVKSGEISLFVFVASGHRKDAIRAAEAIVELIKEKLPIWKKEYFENETYVWTKNKD